MTLARRGGLPGHPIIDPDEVGGYIQAIRGKYTTYVAGADTNSQFANACQPPNLNSLPIQLNDLEDADERIATPELTREPALGEFAAWLSDGGCAIDFGNLRRVGA